MTSSPAVPKINPSIVSKNRQSIKTLIASVSLATTLGGWAVLANDREPVSKAASVATPRPTSTVVTLNLPPLPTLVPLSVLSPALTPIATAPPAPQPTLRVVNQPPPQRVVFVGGGGDSGGDSSGSGSEPAAQTSSSR